MFKQKLSLAPKIAIFFMLAVLMSLVLCGLIIFRQVQNILEDKMALQTEQTLVTAMDSLHTYEKTLSLPVDLLTRKDPIKKLIFAEGNYEKYQKEAINELVSVTKVIDGSVKAFYAMNNGTTLYGWYGLNAEGEKKALSELTEKDLTHEEWYLNCQGRGAGVHNIFSYYTTPYPDPETGEMIFTVCQEVKQSGEVQGVVGLNIKASYLEEYINDVRLMNTGFVVLLDNEGNIIVNDERNNFFKSNIDETGTFGSIKNALADDAAKLNAASDDASYAIASYTGKFNGHDWLCISP